MKQPQQQLLQLLDNLALAHCLCWE